MPSKNGDIKVKTIKCIACGKTIVIPKAKPKVITLVDCPFCGTVNRVLP